MSTVVISGISPGVVLPIKKTTPTVGGSYTAIHTSTSAALGVGGVYDSTAVIPVGCKTVVAYAASNVASAATGFVLQASPDNVTWFDIASASVAVYSMVQLSCFSCNNPLYYRVHYTNGAVAQSVFFAGIVGID